MRYIYLVKCSIDTIKRKSTPTKVNALPSSSAASTSLLSSSSALPSCRQIKLVAYLVDIELREKTTWKRRRNTTGRDFIQVNISYFVLNPHTFGNIIPFSGVVLVKAGIILAPFCTRRIYFQSQFSLACGVIILRGTRRSWKGIALSRNFPFLNTTTTQHVSNVVLYAAYILVLIHHYAIISQWPMGVGGHRHRRHCSNYER